jgi:diguanylate cyclase (GGDEF)-like protein/PAS domain S-box-containing protein
VHKERYSQLFYASLDAVVRIDEDNRILRVNDKFVEMFKYDNDELVGEFLDDFIVEKQFKNEARLLNARAAHGETFTTDAMRIDRYNNLYHVFITGIPIMVEDTYRGSYVIYRDRTFEMQSKRALLNQKMTFESLFRNSNDAIAHIDVSQRIIDINERFETLFGYTLEEIKGKKVDFLILEDERIDEGIELTNRLMAGEKIVDEGVRYNKKGQPRICMVQGVPIIADGLVIGGYGIYTDVTERKEAENEVLYMSYHDQLTGLYNRRFFEAEFERLNTERFMPISLIMADVNGLKLINDAFGHKSGDELLKMMASVLKLHCRESEIIARLSGDEFVLLLPNTSEDVANMIVARLKVALHRKTFKNIEFSMSFGSGSKTSVEASNKTLFKQVEDQMYRNKLVESPSIRGQMFDTVIKTLHAKNKREERHSSRVSEYCEGIAKEMKKSAVFVQEMKTAGWLHDIGKIAISDNILDKPGALTEEEWKEIRKHPEIAYRILNSVHEFTELSEHILHHHERYDGKGYPKGIKGEAISLHARIIAVADAYDAMTSDRTYRKALSLGQAKQQLIENSGTQFDPSVVAAFLKILEDE